MPSLAALCSLLFLAQSLSAARPGYDRASDADPIAPELAKIAASGYSVAERVSTRVGKELLVAVLCRKGEGQSYHLRAYRLAARKTSLILYEPAFGARMVLASIHAGGGIPDLLGDGSRVLAYESTLTQYSKLVVLRYARGKVQRVTDLAFSHFEDIDGDGGLEIVEQSRPLGKFFQLECESFFTQAQAAFRTRIHSLTAGPDKAVLRDVSASHPYFYERRIRDIGDRLAAVDLRKTRDYGGYLGPALSQYFDYAEIGRGKEGWAKFRERFTPRASDPAKVSQCLREMETTLRRELKIPEGW